MNPQQPLVSAAWLFSNRNNPDLLIMDASLGKPGAAPRRPGDRPVIPGAVFFDLEGKFSDPDSPLPHMMPTAEKFTREAQNLGVSNNSIIVVYDDAGIYASPRTWWMFRAMGHDRVYVLDGGLPQWIREGYETRSSHAQPTGKGNFVARYNPDFFADKNDVLHATRDAGHLVIDARSADRFAGKVPEPRAGLRRGHMPHAANIPFTDVLKEDKYLDPGSLAKKFQELDAGNKEIICSCGSGVTACVVALAATLAGHKRVRVYDGSWSEWGMEGEWPVVTGEA